MQKHYEKIKTRHFDITGHFGAEDAPFSDHIVIEKSQFSDFITRALERYKKDILDFVNNVQQQNEGDATHIRMEDLISSFGFSISVVKETEMSEDQAELLYLKKKLADAERSVYIHKQDIEELEQKIKRQKDQK